MKIPFTILFLFFLGKIWAVPYHGDIHSMNQPDGSKVDVKLYGNEFYIRAESPDGYSVVRDSKSGWICYAVLKEDQSELISSGFKLEKNKFVPASLLTLKNFQKHLDISDEARKTIVQKNIKLLSPGVENATSRPGHPLVLGTPIFPVEGNIVGLTILIDFSDEPSTLPKSEYVGFCNDLSYSNFGNNGSLRTYYKDVSGGKVDYTNSVVGFFRAAKSFGYYDSLPYASGAQIILKNALDSLEAQGFDFSTLTLNPDNSIMAINLMYTGTPPVWAQGMWHHKGTFTGFVSATSGISTYDYNCSPANEPLGIGVIAHENGHMIGKWPDTYKYKSNNGDDGIGTFDLMCNYGSNQNPPPPNPLFWSNANWGKTVDITGKNVLIRDTANSFTCYKYVNPTDSNEFFMLENRKIEGRNMVIPDEGLTIWRMNRNESNQTSTHEVKLIIANGSSTSQSSACFGAPTRSEFSNFTVPASSRWTNQDLSGLRISEISTPQQIMTYRIGASPGSGLLEASYLGLTSDPNVNGHLDPNELVQISFNLKNSGLDSTELGSGTISSSGTNSGLVSFPNPLITFTKIATNEAVTLTFPIQVNALTEIGKEVTINFLIKEGLKNRSFVRKFLIGDQMEMRMGKDSVCELSYLDPGGNVFYKNNAYITQTLYPKIPGSKLRANFTAFRLETSSNCDDDGLIIYNGPSANSFKIGTYCGTSSPGTITSTHSSGALTFRFYSDWAGTNLGWQALLSCFFTTEISPSFEESLPEPYPNPTNGTLHFSQIENNFNLEIFDLLGHSLLKTDLISGLAKDLDLRKIKPQILLVKYSNQKGSWVKKVVLEK